MDYFADHKSLTLADLINRMMTLYDKCSQLNIDLHDATEHCYETKEQIADITNELKETEESLYDACHTAAVMCLFHKNTKREEEFSLSFSQPVKGFVKATISNLGYIWFADDKGVEVYDYDMLPADLYCVVRELIRTALL